jgi:hypothetical protein
MNKKLWYGFVAVFVLTFLSNWVINMRLMMPDYQQTAPLWRPEMNLGVIGIVDLFFAFFFTLIFSYGYDGKGWLEGLRFGIYVSLMMNVSRAYMTYATMPIPYSLALKWFLYGTVQFMIYGVVLAVIYGKSAKEVVPEPKTMETAA